MLYHMNYKSRKENALLHSPSGFCNSYGNRYFNSILSVRHFLGGILFFFCHGDEDAEHGKAYIAYIRILVESGEDAVTEEEFLIIFADLMGGYEDVVPADHGKCLGERDQFLLHRGAFGCVEDEMDVIVGSILRGAFRREEGAYIYVPAVVGKCRGGKFSCFFIVIIFKLRHEKPRTAAIQFFEETA